MKISVRRVHDEPRQGEGLAVLVDRLWPRGVSKESLAAEWAKELAPSTALRTWFHEDPADRFEEFAERYRDELAGSGAVLRFLDDHPDEDAIVLLFAAKDRQRNHALVLQQVFEEALAHR
jgi:uncharacterized protein YeaO (DUF488 family)